METNSVNKRLRSLDVFRGLTVACMILVNNPGDWGHIYAPLEHSEWNGCTPTDLIFPFFLFIVGVSIVFSFKSKKSDLYNHSKLIRAVAKRAFILFSLGFFLSLFPLFDFSTVRIPGVLQRISIVYLICSILFINADNKTLFKILAAILIFYWLILSYIPVPGFGPANLGKETNLAAWLDRLIFTKSHIWSGSKTWDPEGILSTLPAIGTGLFGMLIGSIIQSKEKSDSEKVAWIFSYGFIAFILGLIFNVILPINKSLWTSSYVVYTGGLASMGLAICYWLIDVKGYSRFTTPFVIYGINAITVFFASGIIGRLMNIIHVTLNGNEVTLKGWLYNQFFTPYFSSPYNSSLAGAIVLILIWYFILWIMYKQNIVIKV